MDDKLYNKTYHELKIHAHALGIPEGAAESFIEESLKTVKNLSKKTTINEANIKRLVTKELKKYHSDLAYVYKNCDKII